MLAKIERSLRIELALVTIIILAGLIIRSVNYKLHLNFSADQGIFSSNALEIFRERKITLLGPTASFVVEGRQLFQGSVIFYTDLVFLLIGGFDPIKSSFAFTFFSMLMVFPLYFGTKWLTNKNTAFFVSILYALLPTIINYTRFLWNINFQLSLTPLLIFSLGLYEKSKNKRLLFLTLTGIVAGALTMFHYQYVLVDIILFLYFGFSKKAASKSLLILFSGMVFGFFPMLVFELRNNFYNTKTILFFLANWTAFLKNNIQGTSFPFYYFISIIFVFFVLALRVLKIKVRKISLIVLVILLFAVDLYLYFPAPKHAFGMVNNWSYLDEAKAHELIIGSGVDNFNVVNLGYNTLAEVQKYLLKKDGVLINFDDYSRNKYLFVITDKDFSNDPAYEIRTFKPSRKVSVWKINDYYSLHLLERTK